MDYNINGGDSYRVKVVAGREAPKLERANQKDSRPVRILAEARVKEIRGGNLVGGDVFEISYT